MEKLLTISVAAYNVAEYIRGTLDSVIHPDCIDAMEILVKRLDEKDPGRP